MEIISKSEAQKRAQALREVPEDIIRKINTEIAQGYALGRGSITYSKPDNMEEVTWLALCNSLTMKGYEVKAESCQHDGEWVRIKL